MQLQYDNEYEPNTNPKDTPPKKRKLSDTTPASDYTTPPAKKQKRQNHEITAEILDLFESLSPEKIPEELVPTLRNAKDSTKCLHQQFFPCK